MTTIGNRLLAGAAILSAAALALPSLAAAEPKMLKWAHVYETSEPYHTCAVAAGDELKKRDRRALRHRGLPGLLARQGGRHQRGPRPRHRRHHLHRPALRRPRLRPDRDRRRALHVPRLDHWDQYRKSDLFKELAAGLPGRHRQPRHRHDLLRRAPRHLEQADPEARGHEGPEDPRARTRRST